MSPGVSVDPDERKPPVEDHLSRPGVTNMKHIRTRIIRRHADLVRWGDIRLEGEMAAIKYVNVLNVM